MCVAHSNKSSSPWDSKDLQSLEKDQNVRIQEESYKDKLRLRVERDRAEDTRTSLRHHKKPGVLGRPQTSKFEP